MSFQADKQLLARMQSGAVAVDAPECREMTRRNASEVDAQVDLLAARLAEVPGPSPGFDTRKQRDQQRYDEILADLETWRALQRDFTEIQLRDLEDELTLSAQRADEAANAFIRQLENFK